MNDNCSSLIQFATIVVITLIMYLLMNNSDKNYFRWIGLYPPKDKKWLKSGAFLLILSMVIMVGPLILFQQLGMIEADILTTGFTGVGLTPESALSILLAAILKTAFAEELLFRGFIGKRLANKFGYQTGNIVQAILFGLPHGLPFILVYDMYIVGVTLMVTAGIVGYLQFRLNEKIAGGSIMPSICLHAIMNILSFTSQALA